MNFFIEKPRDSTFGGNWSDRKLQALSRYLKFYTTALKRQKFSLIYIDAFAGTGKVHVATGRDPKNQPLLAGMEQEEKDEEQYRHGSPLVALTIDPPFDEFIFIDKNEQSLRNLQEQVAKQNHTEKSISYLPGDANEELVKVCRKIHWKSHRAVAFVDPFATEVKWETIEQIANTKSVDLWLLFPAMAVNRMLPKDGKISPQWKDKLNECFGTNDWLKVFYKTNDQPTIFDDNSFTMKIPNPFEALGGFVNDQLKTIFPGVSNKNIILKNSRNSPLFLLCFACSNPNPKAYSLAIKIANHIIGTS